MNSFLKTWLLPLAAGAVITALLCGVLHWSYRADNKYTAGPPYGQDGVFAFTEQDLQAPLFLIDGWLLSVDGGPAQQTFLGEYSNFSYLQGRSSPFGSARYALTLQCPGTHTLMLQIPEVFSRYTLYAGGVEAARNGSGTAVTLVVQDQLQLVWEVENQSHYYSGLYYPPILGSGEVMLKLAVRQQLFYGGLCVLCLTLALFTLVLWAGRGRDRLFFHFGLLCLSFFVQCLHPFIWQAGLTGRLWYALEDTARIFMLLQAVCIGAECSGWVDRRVFRRSLQLTGLAVCGLVFLSVSLIIPNSPNYINLYGHLLDCFILVGWLLVCVELAFSLLRGAVGGALLAGGCFCLGVGFFVNLLNNNRFEPICFGWQSEYAGLFLVLCFGGLMALHTLDLVRKNRALMAHMEQLVQDRTRELSTMLQERKNFFADVAHNLKAPITAIHSFTSLIQSSNLYLDEELRDYIRLIEGENEQIHRRVQSLSALNSFDQITQPRQRLEVDGLLELVRRKNEPEAGVMGLHFQVHPLGSPAYIFAQQEKLLIAFENLIYNAISFTPAGGSITITPRLQDSMLSIDVRDTGCGIAPQKLPFIFDRFYTSRVDASEGSGLGLYIVKLTIEELGGSICASSQPGCGTVFTMQLPLA